MEIHRMDPYPIGELATDKVTGFQGKITAVTHEMGRNSYYTLEGEADSQMDECGCVRSFASSRTLLLLPAENEGEEQQRVPVEEAIEQHRKNT